MRLSKHFTVQEIFPTGPEPDKLELFLAAKLCKNVLEVLRDIADEPCHVTDGRRLHIDHINLEHKHYHPSKTTDHTYGPGFWHPSERVMPGPWFFGMGAADVLPIRGGECRKWTKEEFEEAKKRLADIPEPVVGQLIFYPQRGHIHASNPRTLLFSPGAISALEMPAKRLAYIYKE